MAQIRSDCNSRSLQAVWDASYESMSVWQKKSRKKLSELTREVPQVTRLDARKVVAAFLVDGGNLRCALEDVCLRRKSAIGLRRSEDLTHPFRGLMPIETMLSVYFKDQSAVSTDQ